jgi:hypothetical protein
MSVDDPSTNSQKQTIPKMESEVSSNSTALAERNDIEASPAASGVAPKAELAVHESEWTVKSSLQVLGAFMLLFNSYHYEVM